jgi:hypothetical protein
MILPHPFGDNKIVWHGTDWIGNTNFAIFAFPIDFCASSLFFLLNFLPLLLALAAETVALCCRCLLLLLL